MSDLALRVERLGKRYRLGQRSGYRTLRETLGESVGRLLGRVPPHRPAEEFWALQEVSFAVQAGAAVGIIGRNGAGKSTLLKILARITEPTEGEADIYGRVGSLLEVGTGFNPELTGRENIFLNGAILGMGRAEIRRKFDEIVAFAGVEKFLDTPVKRYSSGMYVRLAFAVAAHLEPDVLLVDEVLAVGDADFQKKCLNKMQSVGAQGRTVFFVSHNLQAVARLCTQALLLDGGRVITAGAVRDVIRTYLGDGLQGGALREWPEIARRPGNAIARLCMVRVCNEQGVVEPSMDIRRPVRVEMEYEVLAEGHVLVPNFHFYNADGDCAFIVCESSPEWRRRPRPCGLYRSMVRVPGNFLAEGTMSVHAALSTLNPVTVHFHVPDAVAFEVVDSLDGDASRGDYAGHFPGAVRPMLDWQTEVLPAGAVSEVRSA
jgi:lipopolysaccharide transport system ATP-binding protein